MPQGNCNYLVNELDVLVCAAIGIGASTQVRLGLKTPRKIHCARVRSVGSNLSNCISSALLAILLISKVPTNSFRDCSIEIPDRTPA